MRELPVDDDNKAALPNPQARKKRRTELENLEISMKGWNNASSTAAPCTARMSHGAAVKREFMLMVEKAGNFSTAHRPSVPRNMRSSLLEAPHA